MMELIRHRGTPITRSKRRNQMSVQENVKKLVALVERGRFIEALDEFYAENATMQENSGESGRGSQTLLSASGR
jgi:hypothetical protein